MAWAPCHAPVHALFPLPCSRPPVFSNILLVVPSELKNAINGRSLTDVGELEQNLVYGDMGSAELIKFLQGKPTLVVCGACGFVPVHVAL